MRRAASRATCTAGNKSATSTPIMAMTTSSSTSVKPAAELRGPLFLFIIQSPPHQVSQFPESAALDKYVGAFELTIAAPSFFKSIRGSSVGCSSTFARKFERSGWLYRPPSLSGNGEFGRLLRYSFTSLGSQEMVTIYSPAGAPSPTAR